MFDVSFDELLMLRPELREKYESFLSAVNRCDRLPAGVLSACRIRVRQIHGLEAGSQPKAGNQAEEVALTIAEKMPFQHHELLDEEVQQVKELFGDDGCVALLTAVAFFDATSRLELAFAGAP